MKKQLSLVGLILLACVGAVHADGWGNLKVQFLLDGKAPKPEPENVNKDVDFCGKYKLVDESLVIGKNNGIANILVYVRTADVPVHPDYAKTANAKVKLSNTNCKFVPRVALLRTSQTLALINNDPKAHNVKVNPFNNDAINPLLPEKTTMPVRFSLGETMASPVSCSIHPWMKGWVLIRPNPYMAASDAKGNLEIKNIPDGTWQFQFWHERAGFIASFTKNGKAEKWRKGRPKLKIAAGTTTDLGVIKIALKSFPKD